jgi:hypothetical protein
MREIVIDTETTGLDPLNGDRVVEIGAVELMAWRHTGGLAWWLRPHSAVIARFFSPLANLSNLLSLNRRRLAKHKPLYLFDASNLANLSNLKTS